ncbi:endonuclease/exonuclease/phosphatase family protein [Chryseobacterium koreense]|uniref:endonuclease/exonuclease/phosphatase family protein n=1 Tax=Chryseobacterium koreense TaxID=232216 RepID=UPI0026EADCAC|nr:endonuclease/exonuclease/phosphatase family protein [Chryseobacterium koreense]
MGKFLRILKVVHFFIIAALLGTLLNGYIKPAAFPLLNLLSLAFPVLMLLNMLLIIFWVLVKKKTALIFIVCSFFLIHPARRWLNFSGKSKETPNLRIVTANIHSGLEGNAKIYSQLRKYSADIIVVQEYHSEFNVPTYENRTKDYEITALNSKYKIVQQGKLVKTGNGNAFYADLNINGKIIRIVNVYLSPFSFNKDEMRPTKEVAENPEKIKYVLKQLIPVFKIHQQEVSEIRAAIDNSPYPVILAGDFNAVPNSYEYYHLGKDLKDVFMEKGNGISTSFHDYKFPIRIDYVFCSRDINPVSYKVDRSVKISDHFPVIAEFKID